MSKSEKVAEIAGDTVSKTTLVADAAELNSIPCADETEVPCASTTQFVQHNQCHAATTDARSYASAGLYTGGNNTAAESAPEQKVLADTTSTNVDHNATVHESKVHANTTVVSKQHVFHTAAEVGGTADVMSCTRRPRGDHVMTGVTESPRLLPGNGHPAAPAWTANGEAASGRPAAGQPVMRQNSGPCNETAAAPAQMGRALSSSHLRNEQPAAIESNITRLQVQQSCPDVTSTDIGNSCIGIAEDPFGRSADDDNRSQVESNVVGHVATIKSGMAGEAGSDEPTCKPSRPPQLNVAVESSGPMNAPAMVQGGGPLSTVGVAQGYPVQDMRAPVRIPSESDYNSATAVGCTAAAGEGVHMSNPPAPARIDTDRQSACNAKPASKPPKLPAVESSAHAATTLNAAQATAERLQISSPAYSDNTCTAGTHHPGAERHQANQAGQTKSDDAPKETAAEEATVDDESPPEATRRVTRSKTAANQKDGAQVGNESPAANSARKRKHRASPSAASAARSKRGRKAPSP